MTNWEANFSEKSRRRSIRARRRAIIFYLCVFGFTAATVTLGLAAVDTVIEGIESSVQRRR